MEDCLESLEIFCPLTETLQSKETASRLVVSPSAIIRIIAKLEDYLDKLLFQHDIRQAELTDFGKQFLPGARALLIQSERLFISGR